MPLHLNGSTDDSNVPVDGSWGFEISGTDTFICRFISFRKSYERELAKNSDSNAERRDSPLRRRPSQIARGSGLRWEKHPYTQSSGVSFGRHAVKEAKAERVQILWGAQWRVRYLVALCFVDGMDESPHSWESHLVDSYATSPTPCRRMRRTVHRNENNRLVHSQTQARPNSDEQQRVNSIHNNGTLYSRNVRVDVVETEMTE